MPELLHFEDLRVGDSWRSHARTVTESDIVQFAGMTGDFNPLHVDHEFARQTPFRKVIAHGLLGLSWVAGLGSHHPQMKTDAFVGIEKWEFLLPAFIGDTVHVQTEVLELEPSGRRRGKVRWLRKLVNQNDEVVQQGHFVTLVGLKRASTKSAKKRRFDAPEDSVPKPHQPIQTK